VTSTFKLHARKITARPVQAGNEAHRDRVGTHLEKAPRYPITGIAGCCARAASGHAVAPPSVAKNFRRPMQLAM
jgi:hypothetical protein